MTSTKIAVHFNAPAVLVSTITSFLIQWHSGSTLIGEQTLRPHNTDPLQQVVSRLKGQQDDSYEIILVSGITGGTTYGACWCIG